MKNIITGILIFITPFLLIYGVISFDTLELNVVNYSQAQRSVISFFGLIFGLFSVAVYIFYLREKNKE